MQNLYATMDQRWILRWKRRKSYGFVIQWMTTQTMQAERKIKREHFYKLHRTASASAFHLCLPLMDTSPIDSGSETASHMRMVWSSEHDANIHGSVGFHATQFTLPGPWQAIKDSSNWPVSLCQIYTFPSCRCISVWNNDCTYSITYSHFRWL